MKRGDYSMERYSADRLEETDRSSGQPAPASIYPGRLNDLLIYTFFMRKGREHTENQAESADDGPRSRREPVTRFITVQSAVHPAPEGRTGETGSDDFFIRVPARKGVAWLHEHR